MKRQLLIFLFAFGMVFFSAYGHNEKMYAKQYYPNGQLKAEGWQFMNTKTDYWIFYHPNGSVASKGHFNDNRRDGYWYFYAESGELEREGHFIQGSSENWWIFYEIGTQNKTKFQYKNNQKNGFCLRYNKNKLIKAEKYEADNKVGEWTSVRSFKRDNPKVSFR